MLQVINLWLAKRSEKKLKALIQDSEKAQSKYRFQSNALDIYNDKPFLILKYSNNNLGS